MVEFVDLEIQTRQVLQFFCLICLHCWQTNVRKKCLHDTAILALIAVSGRPLVAAVPVMIIAMPVPIPVAAWQKIESNS